MSKRTVKLTETDLKNIINESVNLILNEVQDTRHYPNGLEVCKRVIKNRTADIIDNTFYAMGDKYRCGYYVDEEYGGGEKAWNEECVKLCDNIADIIQYAFRSVLRGEK